MDDPRNRLINAFDTDALKVRGFTPYIFFCGGVIGNESPPYSLREYTYNYLLTKDSSLFKRITLAEEITDWFRNGTYKDLISFEAHIASLSALIVLFVESPGAIAELGAFCLVPEIASRLRVFIREEHYESDSFINLGPIKYLEDRYPGSVHVYPWEIVKETGRLVVESAAHILPDIHEDISNCLNGIPNETKFDTKNNGHQMLLICDILDLMICLTVGELKEYLMLTDISLDDQDIKQYLFLLGKLGMIKQISYGKERYYISLKDSCVVGHKFREQGFDRDRLAIKIAEIRSYYEDEKPRRLKAVKRYDASNEGEGMK